MDRYALMGHPIAHSKSPFIHGRFAEQTGERLSYEAIGVEPGGFAEALEEFQSSGAKGLNVTLPFKEEAHDLCQQLSERATQAGAANTLWFDEDGRRCGDNTDGVGLVRDLRGNLGLELAGQRILLLGAGGAARGVLGPLLATGPGALVIANRTHERAVRLAERFAAMGPVTAAGFPELDAEPFHVIINATSASLEGSLPPVPAGALGRDGACYDMMYAARATPFVRWGREAGAHISVDGVGMLVEQAAEAFALWRGKRPETAGVIAELRRRLAEG
jgi:shikimate dehydrogenase